MSILDSYDEIIRAVAERNEISFDLIKKLIALEEVHGNLHGYGARPALKRAVNEIIGAALAESGNI